MMALHEMAGKVYILVDGEAVIEWDAEKWLAWYTKATCDGTLQLADTKVGDVRVSTAFLGIDDSFPTNSEAPILWETTARRELSIDRPNDWVNHEKNSSQYTNKADALAGHARWVRRMTRRQEPFWRTILRFFGA